MGFNPDEVYEAICNLSSMYNDVLSETYKEIDELKSELEFVKRNSAAASVSTSDYTPNELYERPYDEPQDVYSTSVEPEKEESVEKVEEKKGSKKKKKKNKKAAKSEKADSAPVLDRKIHKLKRGDLLEILITQSHENENLRNELERVKEENEELQQKLNDRKIKIAKAGTLAEAAFAINGVVDSVHAAAQQYLDNLDDLCKREAETVEMKELKTRESTQKMIDEAVQRSNEIIQSAEEKSSALTFITQERCDLMKEDTEAYCQALKAETQQKCDEDLQLAQITYDMKVKEFENSYLLKEKEIIERCERKERETEIKCAEMVAKAENDVEMRWAKLSTRLEDFYKAHAGLRELLASTSQLP
jgi:hypothetical protein